MAELSAYEAKRRRRMEENRAALLALQIERLPAPKRPRRGVNKETQPTQRRRSARLEELKTLGPEQRERARRLEKRERLNASYSEVLTIPKAYHVLPATPLDLPMLDLSDRTVVGPRVSTKELDISVARFHEQWLGKQLVPLGKNWVMQGLIDAGVETEKKPIAVYSQLSGVQQFRNAFALFVNVERDINYDNVFQEVGKDGKRVVFFRWFAQKNWSRETPPIRRLVRVRRGDARFFLEHADSASDGVKEELEDLRDEPLLLFLRQVQVSELFLWTDDRVTGADIRVELSNCRERTSTADASGSSGCVGRRSRSNFAGS